MTTDQASSPTKRGPFLGAWCAPEGTYFRVWAPAKQRVEVQLETPGHAGAVYPLRGSEEGFFSGVVPGVRDGDRYRYRVDGEGPFPDPASRFQPDGVHGASQVVDTSRFEWSDASWRGVGLENLVLYELHVGAFTRSGTFAGVIERLPYLRDLGVTAIEIMPIADFPGQRNWGYDGAALFAPARCYGVPDDLARLVDTAHRLGLAVILDVVYNHVGPDGAYLTTFSPYYFSAQHFTPWGPAINLDGAHSRPVRDFFIANASHWVREYHMDGLRLDATHALLDESRDHFLAELARRVRAVVPDRQIVLIAEDHRNLAHIVRSEGAGGWGLDAVWADDFHHQVRRGLAGDCEGYYRDYSGAVADLATIVRQGWFYCGQHSEHLGGPRGTDPTQLMPRRFVICVQNHDQVGNRAFGERLHQQIDLAAYRAATVLLLCAPELPLLFMGQEWGATSPFLFFADHRPDLAKLVTAGRRREFADFPAFSDVHARQRIPDPQEPTTFLRSRLNWSECTHEPHALTLRLYQRLLELRRTEPLLRATTWAGFAAAAIGEHGLVLLRTAADANALLVVIHLHGAGTIHLGTASVWRAVPAQLRWEIALCTEEPPFAPDPLPPVVDLAGAAPIIHFARPGAAILRAKLLRRVLVTNCLAFP